MTNSDSPVSQLLQHALAPAAQSQEHSSLGSPNDGKAALDFSLDSRIIPVRPVTPRYRLQFSSLQSPENSGEFVVGEYSQKDDHCKKGRESEVGTCPLALSNNVPVQLRSGSGFFHQHGFSPVTASSVKVIGTRTVSFQSPPITAPRPKSSMPVRDRQYRRSPSPASQDSFGGPISQDPAELYLATAREFNVPLSNLEETPTQEVVHSQTDPGMTLPDASEHKEFLEAAMREYEEQRANGAIMKPVRVLVAATPSNSDESLNLPRYKDDGVSFHDYDPEPAAREPRYEFNSSSSFDKMLDRDLADPTPEPSQSTGKQLPRIETAETQPSSGHGVAITPPHDSKRHSSPFDWIAPTPSTKVTSSDPRSLLRMVHPQNQYRIAMMRHLAGDVEPPSYLTTGAETQPSRTSDTQPAHADDSNRPNAFLSAHRALRQSDISGSRPATPRKDTRDDEPEDLLDVIPDSEPLRVGSSTETPSRHDIVRRSSPKKFQPSDVGSEEVIPDSLEVEGSEEDIPLAAALKETKKYVTYSGDVPAHSRKVKATPTVPAKTSIPEKQAQKPVSSTARTRNSRAKPGEMDILEVPTSLPEQDLQGRTSSSVKPDSENPLPPKTKLQPLASSRARRAPTTRPSATKPVAGGKRAHKSDSESSEDLICRPTRGESVHPKAQGEEEEETGSASDHFVVSTPSPPPKPDISRQKRRRTEDANSTRGTSKASTSSRAQRSEAVVTRSAMKLRSGLSSTRTPTAKSATRVFALWIQDGHYYSGTLQSRAPQNKYLVRFDDKTEDEVDLRNLRRRDLLVGDQVIIIQSNITGTVCDTTNADSRHSFMLEVDDGNSVLTVQAKFCDIRIANRIIQSRWKERMVDPEAIVTKDTTTHMTPSKNLTITAHRELAKTGFVVTIAPRNSSSTQAKDNVLRAIRRRGGVVIDDWSAVLAVDGVYGQDENRWTATPKDIRWQSRADVNRVFLLSDDACQTPKFLLALALGVPCISFEWLTSNEGLPSDWQQYLLPAGYSHALGTRVSQLVDIDWGSCIEHLEEIMENKASIKLFTHKTVLLVGAELVPKKNALDDSGRYCAPWTILCMGAAKVEAVADAGLIALEEVQAFDYIIYKDLNDLKHLEENLKEGAVVGSWNWVKDCLIAARLGPPTF